MIQRSTFITVLLLMFIGVLLFIFPERQEVDMPDTPIEVKEATEEIEVSKDSWYLVDVSYCEEREDFIDYFSDYDDIDIVSVGEGRAILKVYASEDELGYVETIFEECFNCSSWSMKYNSD